MSSQKTPSCFLLSHLFFPLLLRSRSLSKQPDNRCVDAAPANSLSCDTTIRQFANLQNCHAARMRRATILEICNCNCQRTLVDMAVEKVQDETIFRDLFRRIVHNKILLLFVSLFCRSLFFLLAELPPVALVCLISCLACVLSPCFHFAASAAALFLPRFPPFFLLVCLNHVCSPRVL